MSVNAVQVPGQRGLVEYYPLYPVSHVNYCCLCALKLSLESWLQQVDAANKIWKLQALFLLCAFKLSFVH